MEQTTTELFEQTKQGDRSAYEQLFRKYYTPLVRFARDIVKDADTAEDLVQEVFVKVWERKATIEIKTSVMAYLYMAVKNHCLNKLKTEQRHAFMEDGLADDLKLSTNHTEEHSDTIKLAQHIQEAIEKLPPRCALIFKMSRFEEKTYKEIAETLELSVKTVENQMVKALQLLRQHLTPYLKMLLAIFAIKGWW